MVDVGVAHLEKDVQVVDGAAGSTVNAVAAHEERDEEVGENVGGNDGYEHPVILPHDGEDKNEVADNAVPDGEEETAEAPDSPGPFSVSIVDEKVIKTSLKSWPTRQILLRSHPLCLFTPHVVHETAQTVALFLTHGRLRVLIIVEILYGWRWALPLTTPVSCYDDREDCQGTKQGKADPEDRVWDPV